MTTLALHFSIKDSPKENDKELSTMGQIKPDIRQNHLTAYPAEESILSPFLHDFDVTWANRRLSHNTECSCYFLKPNAEMEQMFGLEHEVILVISNFSTLEPRAMLTADSLFGEYPAVGRVEQSFFILATDAVNSLKWTKDYTARNPQARIPIVFAISELRSSSSTWLIRNGIRNQLFSRDLFNYQLPLQDDLYFFGRTQIITEHISAVKASQNRGLFGLRKTGKTSILYKIRRVLQRDGVGVMLYYDCKLPSIRMLRWHELLARIVTDVAEIHNIKCPRGLTNEKKISDKLISLLEQTPTDKTTLLVFDEVEFISPLNKDDEHWNKDFVPFWQTLWSAQSQVRRLSNIVVGLNSTLAELESVNGVQNPLFGVVTPCYIKGLDKPEMSGMVDFIGARMGLRFEEPALDYLQCHYGGHPLLTRLACSRIHCELDEKKVSRPALVTLAMLKQREDERDDELAWYSGHVIAELKKFYPLEYELLEMVASGEIPDAMELTRDASIWRHLRSYGVLSVDNSGKPTISIPTVAKYVATELARKEGRRLLRRVVPVSDRTTWLSRRVRCVIDELRDLCKVSEAKNTAKLFEGGVFPEADRFVSASCVSDRESFTSFVNTCNRCFVESLEKAGLRMTRKNGYLQNEIRNAYPDFWHSLRRIKVYRNDSDHLELRLETDAELKAFLDEDLEGRRYTEVQDVWFVLQQCIIDGLLVGVRSELNRLA